MHCPFLETRLTLILLSLVTPCLAAGCAPRQHLSTDFGEAYFIATKAQILNLEAPRYPGPVDTLPGDIAVKIYKQRYIKSLIEDKKEQDSFASELGN